MSPKRQLAARIGFALLLMGGAGFASGSVMEAQYDCVSGTSLAIEKVVEPNTTDGTDNATVFTALSPVEQRIFLEAYTESSDNQRYGETYANWSEEWFASNRSNRSHYIAYQNEYWKLRFFASDCGISGGVFFQIGGILGSIVGGVILAIIGVWRLRDASR